MSDRVRYLILQCVDTKQSLLPLMYNIYHFSRHEEVLSYLVRQKITGDKLLTFQREFNNSVFEMVKYIVEKIDHREKHTIQYGLDWRPPQ